ncbi:hypothetical protein [Streptomyces xantholiticus]|uniref:Uncharacterized protein n=1 Tax=Streptomyces xantholiticus TaxID=68285 RepID=A0ABV1UVR5_9ACTN
MPGSGAPDVTELVGRARRASAPVPAAQPRVPSAARELLTEGTYGSLLDGYDYGEINALLGK